jgi:hypothetical protein
MKTYHSLTEKEKVWNAAIHRAARFTGNPLVLGLKKKRKEVNNPKGRKKRK